MALDTPHGAAAKLGRYELLKEQAKTGLGATWLARATGDAADAPLRSVLRVQRNLVKKADLAEGLLADAKRAEGLRHPNALGLIDAGKEDGEIYLVTEYAEGELLSALMTAAGLSGLPLRILLRIALDTAAAVAAAHAAAQLCHGELSPQHLLVGTDGVTRVVGFGTARGLARLPLLGAKNGDRLAYAAPERVKSMASAIAPQIALEPRADVFALGVMLWEATTKQRLFASKIEAAVIQKVLTAPIPAPSAVAGVKVSPALDAAIRKAIERDPLRRFQTAAELEAAIAGVPEPVATHAEVAEQVERLAGKALSARRTLIDGLGPRTNGVTELAGSHASFAAKPISADPQPTAPVRSPAEERSVATRPLDPGGEPLKPAGRPLPARNKTLMGIMAPKLDAPLPVEGTFAPAKPDATKTTSSSAAAFGADDVEIDVSTSESEPPAEADPRRAGAPPARAGVNARAPILAAPADRLEEPAPRPPSAETRRDIKVDPAAAPSSGRQGPLSERKTGATPTSDTPISDSVQRGKFATAIDKIGPASTLGRYEILSPIARGGMASVWAARLVGTRGFQKLVAVKTMLPDVSDDPDFEQMFLDEARVAARIRHPNVAEILDLGEQDDVLYLVMEWVDGENLSVVLKAARALGGMPLPIVLRIAAQACAGLHAAHELRDDNGHLVDLIHRDVSPANVLVSTAGFVKLVDFGVAKSKGRMHVTRAGGMVKGKTPYLSPEQLGGLALDRRSDIFSFGALLYVMATGLHPFRGETEGKTVENIALKSPVPLRTINPALPIEFEKLVLKCLEKDPKNRFSSAAELQRALDQISLSLGEPTSESDVADFVRKVIGEAQAKRAQDIKSAIAALDALTSGSGDVPRADVLRFLDGGKRPASSKPEPEPPSTRRPRALAEEHAVDLAPILGTDAPRPATRSPAADSIATVALANAETRRPPPLKPLVGEETSPPSTLDDAAVVPTVAPRSRRFAILVGVFLVAAVLIGVIAALRSAKAPTSPAEPEPTLHEGAPSPAIPIPIAPTPSATVDATPSATPTAASAAAPSPSGAPSAPPDAEPTADPASASGSKSTPKSKGPAPAKAPPKAVKPPIPKK